VCASIKALILCFCALRFPQAQIRLAYDISSPNGDKSPLRYRARIGLSGASADLGGGDSMEGAALVDPLLFAIYGMGGALFYITN